MPLPNVNDHHSSRWARAKMIRDIRGTTRELAVAADIPPLTRIGVVATFYAADRRRRDAPNILYLTSKSMIDGLVDAGVIPDDNDKIVKYLVLLPGEEKIPGSQVVIEVVDLDDERVPESDRCAHCRREFLPGEQLELSRAFPPERGPETKPPCDPE